MYDVYLFQNEFGLSEEQVAGKFIFYWHKVGNNYGV